MLLFFFSIVFSLTSTVFVSSLSSTVSFTLTSCCSKFDFGLELGEFGCPAAFDLEEVLSIRELEAGEVALLIEVKSGDVL